MRKVSNLVLIAFFIFTSSTLFGQKRLQINGICEYKGAPLGNVEVTITKDGEEVGKFSTEGEGDFYVELATNGNYTFRAKRNGYITRYIILSTHLKEGQKMKKKFNFNLSMFKEGNTNNPKNAYDIPLVVYDPDSKKLKYKENF